MKGGRSSHLWSDFDGNCIFVDGFGAIWKIFIQTNQMRPEANSRSHLTSKVNLGLWPHLAGLYEYLSNSTQTIHKYGPYLNHFFRIFGHGCAPSYWGWPLELIRYHFDRVVFWPLRSTLASGLFWLVWVKIFQKSIIHKFLIPTNFSLLCPFPF